MPNRGRSRPLPTPSADDPMTAEVCRSARRLLNWTALRLAVEADVSEMTIYKLERGGALQPRSLLKIRTALQSAGVIPSVQNGGNLMCSFESPAMLTAQTCRQARQLLGWSLQQLGGAASVTDTTVRRLEMGRSVRISTATTIRTALEAAGVEFYEENGSGLKVRLRSTTK